MVRKEKRSLRLLLGFMAPIIAMLGSPGCGNPGEGTVTVSPEARQRLRGGPSPAQSPATSAKPVAKKVVNVKEMMRRNPGE